MRMRIAFKVVGHLYEDQGLSSRVVELRELDPARPWSTMAVKFTVPDFDGLPLGSTAIFELVEVQNEHREE